MKKVILAGNSITSEIIYNYLKLDKRYQVIGLTVDDEYLQAGRVGSLKQAPISQVDKIFPKDECSVIMAMGYSKINQNREKFFLHLKSRGYKMESYTHPDSLVFSHFDLGEGCVILPNSVIEPFVKIGANTMIWSNVTIAHHAEVAENCWLASGATISGMVKVKKNSFLGVNSTIVNNVTVGEYNIIGASTMISKNTKSNSVYLSRSGEKLRYGSSEYIKFVDF